MRKLSLFSGIGGIDLAAHWAGMHTVAFCEREPFPQRVLSNHWPGVPIYEDVCTLTKEVLIRDGIVRDDRAIDIISAGYPCQPFSHAGKREGAEDDRHLWPEVKRILEEVRPRWFLGENVAGHITLGLDDVLSDLESIDYIAQAIVVPAAAVGAMHRRDRVFILGYTERSGCNRESWRGAEPELADGYFGMENGSMAYTASKGLSKRRQSRFTESNSETGTGVDTEPKRCSQAMADTSSSGREECDIATISDRSGHGAGGIDAGRRIRATQSSMGGGSNELSARLDGREMNPLNALLDFIEQYPQPAPRGIPQYYWEPPRVASGIKNRIARLQALGNAVDPLQVYPILWAINWIDDQIRKGMKAG